MSEISDFLNPERILHIRLCTIVPIILINDKGWPDVNKKKPEKPKKSDMEMGDEHFFDPFSITFHSVPHQTRVNGGENKRNSKKTKAK
ncbi:MAG TPA: hypothetical protein DEQ02_04080 [Ruminococcaceae bacterium]|nr:hypothetical protein [Oscillospiraceae bacterium]